MSNIYAVSDASRYPDGHLRIDQNDGSRRKPGKRLIVCCDGYVLLSMGGNEGFMVTRTWQDGVIVNAKWKYTNVLVRRSFDICDTCVICVTH